jgi:hypothetical protein
MQGHHHAIPTQAGGADTAARLLRGKPVLVPTSALAAIELVHGPGRYLHGVVKVDASWFRLACLRRYLPPHSKRSNWPLPTPSWLTQWHLFDIYHVSYNLLRGSAWPQHVCALA